MAELSETFNFELLKQFLKHGTDAGSPMIFGMRTLSCLPLDFPKLLKLKLEVGDVLRGSSYGKNYGAWISEFGQLNRIWELWAYNSLADYEYFNSELLTNKEWINEYCNLATNWLTDQNIRLMKSQLDFKTPITKGNIFEYRYYSLENGMRKKWIDLLKDVLPVRETYSELVGLWSTITPQPNEVSHLWRYTDLNSRQKIRAELASDENWVNFQRKGRPLLRELNSVILRPTSL